MKLKESSWPIIFSNLIKQEVHCSLIFNYFFQWSPQELNIQLNLLESTPVKSLEPSIFL